jgi:hypothetical protein
MRSVVEYNIGVETSIGRVQGVLWDDGELGIGSPLVAELDRSDVRTRDSLSSALEAVGVPASEAETLASTLWDDAQAAYARAAPRARTKVTAMRPTRSAPFVALAISAAVTLFLVWEPAARHANTHPVGQRILLWVVFWLALAGLIRVAMFLARRVRRRNR